MFSRFSRVAAWIIMAVSLTLIALGFVIAFADDPGLRRDLPSGRSVGELLTQGGRGLVLALILGTLGEVAGHLGRIADGPRSRKAAAVKSRARS